MREREKKRTGKGKEWDWKNEKGVKKERWDGMEKRTKIRYGRRRREGIEKKRRKIMWRWKREKGVEGKEKGKRRGG